MYKIIVLLIATLLAASTGIGDEQECEPITVRESPDLYNQIEGSLEPDKIPDWLKYRVFASMYNVYIDELVQKLSARDHAILDTLTTEREYWQTSESARYGRGFLDLCTNRSNMDAVTFARDYERIAAESNNRGADRTRKAIQSLSSSGRQAVENYIEETITPKLSFPRTNSVDSALKDPESAMFNLEIMCYMQINGEPPPEMQRMMECFRQQRGIGPDNDSSKPSVTLSPNQEKSSLSPSPEN